VHTAAIRSIIKNEMQNRTRVRLQPGSRRAQRFLATVICGIWLTAAAQPVPHGSELLVALLIDTSGSIRQQDLILARQLAAALMRRLPAGSQLAVYSFDDRPRLLQPWTEDPRSIDLVLASLAPGGKHTVLYDTVYTAVGDLAKREGRTKAIVVVTDGRDEKSDVKLTDATDSAKEAMIPLYTVGIGRVKLPVLHRMAALTYGAYVAADGDAGRDLASRLMAGRTRPDSASKPTSNPASQQENAQSLNVQRPGGEDVSAGQSSRPHAKDATRASSWWWPLLGILALAAMGGVVLVRRRPRRPAPPSGDAGRVVAEPSKLPVAPAGAPLDDATVIRAKGFSQVVLNRTELVVLGDGTLMIKGGDGTGQVFSVTRKADTLVGRSPLADVRLPDPTVSQEHCRISARRGFFLLQDLNSTNGTLVNGEKVREHVLRDGDIVKIGDTALEFHETR
jgi:hypothetical protein